MQEYEGKMTQEEEKKKREEEEVLKKMKALDVSKFETQQSETVANFGDFIDFAKRESEYDFKFVVQGLKSGFPAVDFLVKNMTLFDVLEKMAKDGKGTYQVDGPYVILKFP